eukprot:TRINITY_DN6746_c0_g1_i8.p3 TRINITY_DN6746_c0_g1~~TRINITY_DN6746_c0_g1_i8.p3  ORF type:complete len:155 (+),score=33.87 TRINITY_DN6746_c0_g1_i8:60-467(+)
MCIRDRYQRRVHGCGQFMNKTTCSRCGHVSLTFDNFWDLSLSFTRALKMLADVELQRLFQEFVNDEQIMEGYKCEKCKKESKVSRKLSIWRLPEVLVVHLKRFDFGRFRREKINTRVRFPVNNLDLRSFVKGSSE